MGYQYVAKQKSSGEYVAHALINHAREDLLLNVVQLSKNDYLIAGATGFDQADTNSVVSNPAGMLIRVNS